MKDRNEVTDAPVIVTKATLRNLFYIIRILGLYPDVVTCAANVPGGRNGTTYLVECAQGEQQIDMDVYHRLLSVIGVTHEVLCLGDHDEIKKKLIELGRVIWNPEDCAPQEAPEHLRMLDLFKKELLSLNELRNQQVRLREAAAQLKADQKQLEEDHQRLMVVSTLLENAKQVIDTKRHEAIPGEVVTSRKERVSVPLGMANMPRRPPPKQVSPRLERPKTEPVRVSVLSAKQADDLVDESQLTVRELMALRRRQKQ